MSSTLELKGKERAQSVQKMFSKIAGRYDLMNRIMTAGQDIHWRGEVIRRAKLDTNDSLLDLGAGTGDLAREALRQNPTTRALAADFTLNMMRAGKKNGHLDWSAADALNLPFPDKRFDAIVSGFLMRNVTDVPRALKEQYRALKPGGRIVILDTTKPRKNILTPLINIHLHYLIPFIGGVLTGERDAYTYLPNSTQKFLRAEELAVHMAAVGFKKINFDIKMFGTVAIHWGEK
ncbi:MAG: ubiquinone/menaquinone biosynthesis methyltransferase [Anaerolineae bacterium]|jgi:demethylmenaquinone methyltransferase/2-methoxy-6-polyprenyl-1,4-benzoquinol methylase|nr:ubiquinone/menaquinone biosynthesis methyltransferase [Anaerolineae bacterium]MBT4312041.1 ubiquinone/menaquinone biosynthesis methyltransferase [Anaerolineae bacterium]MBT4459497.1 ubiquinone/menaquinone biosynthesis methyltransferase [Anaerolineae bacterium]MBT4842105.1 ubiquinone/menaquinone biosynthesis methyltransferase [Anaerolineae bacterium]MBT6062255.1 ubiquinone/menaquinone biosynthesis methyltransferase [Anaerolineae bacterium]